MPADVVDTATRSRMMAGIRGKNTKPELVIRKGLHAAGFRYRLHDRKLPGRPDIVLPRYQAAVFIHGCFWHGHDCSLFKWPQSRQEFWEVKILGNRARDETAIEKLDAAGWRVLVIWECALKGPGRIGTENIIKMAGDWLRSEERRRDIRGN